MCCWDEQVGKKAFVVAISANQSEHYADVGNSLLHLAMGTDIDKEGIREVKAFMLSKLAKPSTRADVEAAIETYE